jgi:hypothetical protein
MTCFKCNAALTPGEMTTTTSPTMLHALNGYSTGGVRHRVYRCGPCGKIRAVGPA